MPKVKTHKGMAKRVKLTKSGKIMRLSARISHLQTRKDTGTKRSHKNYREVSPADKKNIKKLI